MKNVWVLMVLMIAIVSCIATAQPILVTHSQFQAVHADGSSLFDDAGPWQVTLEGLLLNSPEEWLDPTADPTIQPWYMGGQWEIFIQGEGDDHAATGCWMGQNYANGPGTKSYSNEDWLAEICRLNRDPATGYVFRPGDRVRVTGTYLFYGGKLNINENHKTDPAFDFTMELVTPQAGLPQPEVVSLSQIKDAANRDIFDPNRTSGGEYYQCRRIRIPGVTVTDPQNWGVNKTITISDDQGRTLPVVLAIGQGITRYPCPTGTIDVIGILDQKAPSSSRLKEGYRLFVFNYDGNGLVLGDSGYPRGNLPGDINHDYVVDLSDFAELAQQWLRSRAGLSGCSEGGE